MRKHYSQMSEAEREEVLRFARELSLHGRPHYYDRAKDRSFTDAQARMAVWQGSLIEVHDNKAPDIRALIRDKEGTCVVVSLCSGDIVTVYYNDPEDHHYTLDKGQYQWTKSMLDVLGEIRSGQNSYRSAPSRIIPRNLTTGGII